MDACAGSARNRTARSATLGIETGMRFRESRFLSAPNALVSHRPAKGSVVQIQRGPAAVTESFEFIRFTAAPLL
ncbi:MAG: hypothetical protein ACJAQ3_002945, partial [Planctomycetota bacterium]